MRSRRIRIVCISDTHNQTPHLPPGDILIHAGDLTRQGSPSELQRAFHWLDGADYKVKIVVAGNHDLGLDRTFVQQGQNAQSQDQVTANIDLFRSSAHVHYLQHETKVITVPSDDGADVSIKVFGSPFSPSHGKWAFGYKPSESRHLWKSIPLDADIVIAHTPAKYHVDEADTNSAGGCEYLRQALWRTRPKLFVCGHIHEAHGVEIVEWDLDLAEVGFKEKQVTGLDISSKSNKHPKLDLSSKGVRRLQNEGYPGDSIAVSVQCNAVDGTSKISTNEEIESGGILGRGGPEDDVKCDRAALSGRRGRCQTCVVNAAYMVRSWPYREKNGKHVNQAVMIDMDFLMASGEKANQLAF